jgi:flagellar L-ring protein FlgH
MARVIILAAVITASWVCQAQQKESGDTPRPDLSLAQLMQGNRGSLFQASQQAAPAAGHAKLANLSYIAVPAPEPRQLKKHDLITIIIREESSISSDGKTDIKKSSNLDARLDEFVKLVPKNWEIQGGALGASPPSVKYGLSRDTYGDAQMERTDSFTSRIAAEVVDVKPNGTVVIQASKVLRHDEEDQAYILTGICRGSDVTPDNSVYSWQIASLSVTTLHGGAVQDAMRRGLIPKLLDFVNPF